jgi:hypothetical protein
MTCSTFTTSTTRDRRVCSGFQQAQAGFFKPQWTELPRDTFKG